MKQSKNMTNKTEYNKFLSDIKVKIQSAQYEAFKKVNSELITLYWDIGSMISEKQNIHGWGKSVLEQLSKDLQNSYPGIRGFSARNIWRMRRFYEEYKQSEFLPPLVAEISWSHNIVILEKCNDLLQREFYIKTAKKFGWTKNVLIHQIENKSFEKYLLNQTNFDKTVPEKYRNQAKLAVKDEYGFGFLELQEEHSERELETAIINNIRKFLLEIGGHFSFIGNQYKITVDEDDYFIDLLLFHRQLKSLVAIELKVGKFIPEFAGKMQFYLSALNDTVKLADENPSIGIIICKSKKQTTVEYALKDSNKPIGIASYTIKKQLPDELKKKLPSANEIIEILKTLD